MITEDYVSFAVAKLLKEKGFDCACEVWYSEYTSQFGGEKYTSIEFDDHNRFKENYKFICYAPTLQRAMKWLREVHKIFIEIQRCKFKFFFTIERMNEPSENEYSLGHFKDFERNTYEETCETAIKYCLENLI